MIPQIFHAIWLGEQPLPRRWEQCWQTWAARHPTWTTLFWMDPVSLPLNVPSFATLTDPRQRADVLRYALLFLYGGVYVDVDFECLRPIDTLLDGVDVFAASEDDSMLSIGILGCTRYHPTFWRVLSALPQALATGLTIGEQSGPAFFTHCIKADALPLTVFPAKLFYPYSGADARRCAPFDPATAPEAYAVHYWASVWGVA